MTMTTPAAAVALAALVTLSVVAVVIVVALVTATTTSASSLTTGIRTSSAAAAGTAVASVAPTLAAVLPVGVTDTASVVKQICEILFLEQRHTHHTPGQVFQTTTVRQRVLGLCVEPPDLSCQRILFSQLKRGSVVVFLVNALIVPSIHE